MHGQKQKVTQIFEAKQAVENILNLFVYDEIKPSETNWWTGETIVSESSSDWFRTQLEANPNVIQINLFVNSVGGYVDEAMGMRAHLLRHTAHKDGYVDGWAASAAAFLLTGCDNIQMLTGSMQFIHEMSSIACGTADYFRQLADQMDRKMVGNRQMFLERTNGKLTEEKLSEMMKAETWLTAQECVDLGMADGVMAASEYKNIVKQTQCFVTLPIMDPDVIPPAVLPALQKEPKLPADPPPTISAQEIKTNLFAAFIAGKGK